MNPPRSIVSLSLVFGAAAVLAAACGSDEDDPSTSQGQLTGGAPGTAGTGQTAASGSGGAAGTPASAGTGGLASGGGEGNPVDVPIDQPLPTEPPAGGGAGGAPAQPPPTGVLAPNCNAPEGEVPNLAVELVAGGLAEPIYVTGTPGDDSRLMILQKGGTVRVVVDGVLQDAPFIDITSQVQNAGERGLLGLAFHPDYATNGLFYLHYSSSGAGDGLPGAGDTVLAEFQVDASNRDAANPASRRIVLTVDQPETNHNGGQITFGRDGMLYLGLGDGGGGNDQHGTIGNGQSLNTLLGKILRLDPTARDVNDAYGIPAGNLAQVTGQQALPEIWAYGLRNPWRFSFDACSGDLYIGDVGQMAQEEVDYVAAAVETQAVAAGLNFGWRIMEGTICGPQAAECNDQTTADLILPVDTYGRQVGQSVTGGYVYRGSSIPGLRGTYIYADYQTKHVFRFGIQDGQVADRVEITDQIVVPGGGDVDNIASFGVDNAGEMYLTDLVAGGVYRIVQAQ